MSFVTFLHIEGQKGGVIMANKKYEKSAADRSKRFTPRDNTPKNSGKQTNKSHGTNRKGSGKGGGFLGLF